MSTEWGEAKCLHIATGFGKIVRDWKEDGVAKRRKILPRERGKVGVANPVTTSYSLYVISILLQVLIIHSVSYRIFRGDKPLRPFSVQSKAVRTQTLQRLCDPTTVSDADLCNLPRCVTSKCATSQDVGTKCSMPTKDALLLGQVELPACQPLAISVTCHKHWTFKIGSCLGSVLFAMVIRQNLIANQRQGLR